MCMVDSGEYWQFAAYVMRRARKEHRCGECRRTINPGERYEHVSGLYDGRWDTERTCEQCRTAARWLEVVCCGFLYGAIKEDLGEHVVGDESYLRSAPLTRLYRWMSTDWRDRDGNLRPIDDVQALTTRAIERYWEQHRRAVAA